MCWMRACFDDYQTTTGRSVTMGDEGSVATAGVGTVVLIVIVQGKTRKIKLEKVLLTSKKWRLQSGCNHSTAYVDQWNR